MTKEQVFTCHPKKREVEKMEITNGSAVTDLISTQQLRPGTVKDGAPQSQQGSNVGNNANVNAQKSSEPDAKALKTAVDKANRMVQSFNRYLNFSVDDSTKEIVVKVVDTNTNEVVRQIPPKEMLSLMEQFDKIQSLIFSKNV